MLSSATARKARKPTAACGSIAPLGLKKGSNSGAVVVAGAPDKSLLIEVVRSNDEDVQMPPKGARLKAAQIADLEAWVKMGCAFTHSGCS